MDMETIKQCLVGLSLAEHQGDVANYLPRLCQALDLSEPEWSDKYERYVMAWEDKSDMEEQDEEE